MSDVDAGGRSGNGRSRRARGEPMRVTPAADGVYLVSTPSGHEYTVDLDAGHCTCPDHQYRGVRCKHLRRVAIEVTAGRVPAPGERDADCADCGRAFHAPADSPGPVYCADCTLRPGEAVVDRERGSLVVVVESTDDRANEVEIPSRGWTVAAHYSNRTYDPEDVVVDVLYPLPRGVDAEDVSPRDLQRYSFPRGRLQRRVEAPGPGGVSSRRGSTSPGRP